ncbi:hypothetical protein GCM10010329_44370 [Streptomyces spiroverticillatus]|uniref:Uncharacterized protein n=1 Tax=Streptomyces finlayi TaxID=67296 RepID=A0A918WZS9_9ACTN|nr:hypothetical protein [Streptomyces finlayi]GHA16594.1 hypothetical protein GCM10010329_44370 [Streptomyces spiroverticillatus]GHC98764.1 hypothetical protein GCM10010334_41550 [Streptomyces finlayi]
MPLSRTVPSLARAAAGLSLIAAPLLISVSPAHAVPMPAAVDAGPCFNVETPPGYTCLPAPKQCIAAPCPQYALVPVTEPAAV